MKLILDRYDPLSGVPLAPKKRGPSRVAPELDNVDVVKTALSLYPLETGKVIIEALKQSGAGLRAYRSSLYRALQRAGVRRVATVKPDLPSDRKRKRFQWIVDQVGVGALCRALFMFLGVGVTWGRIGKVTVFWRIFHKRCEIVIVAATVMSNEPLARDMRQVWLLSWVHIHPPPPYGRMQYKRVSTARLSWRGCNWISRK